MAAKPVVSGLRRFVYNLSGFNKYGLMLHDTYYGTPQVLEAVRRLPSEVREARDFRMKRALQLSLQKVYLPKEEWTQVEDDVPYLAPFLKEVEEENKSYDKWNSK